MPAFIDITGERYGRLTAVRREGVGSRGSIRWLFKCECGKECMALAYEVRNGHTKSCGCLKIDTAYNMGKTNISKVSPNKTHGMRNTRLYGIWVNMRTRCYNPKTHNWDSYGGKGITVCDEWRTSPLQFIEWALSNGYSNELTIDRIDNDKGYSPNNCRWATTKEQGNNQTKNRMITAFGETKTLQQWADQYSINSETLSKRIKRGLTSEEAMTMPIKHQERHVNV